MRDPVAITWVVAVCGALMTVDGIGVWLGRYSFLGSPPRKAGLAMPLGATWLVATLYVLSGHPEMRQVAWYGPPLIWAPIILLVGRLGRPRWLIPPNGREPRA